MTLEFEPERGFGIYLHWPYCAKICPYCDFNVYAAKSRDTAPLVSALRHDLTHWRKLTGPRQVDSIFFGGGTPSLLPPAQISELIAHIKSHWGLAEGAEITLEANPDDMSRFEGAADAGVTRLSLGVQSLQDDELRFLGRNHDAGLARKAIEEARRRFASLSVDFIYALPEQTIEDWLRALDEALLLDADHLSLYELTIEPGAAFARAVARKNWTPADEDMAADLYELTQAKTDAAGYPAYEISNHARGAAHQSRHNRIYWRSGDWVGVGPGAHGRLTIDGARRGYVAQKRPGDYQDQISAHGNGIAETEQLSIKDVAVERLIMGLRMSEGLARSDIESLTGQRMPAADLDRLGDEGLLVATQDHIHLTAQGRLLADHVAARLIDTL